MEGLITVPHLYISVLDIEGSDCITAGDLAAPVLRQYWVNHWESTGSLGVLKDIPQFEISLRGGVSDLTIIRTSPQLNDRYNARHRKIQTEIAPSSQAVEVTYKGSKEHCVLRGVPQSMARLNADPTVSIQVQYTTLFAIRMKHVGSYFLHVGTHQDGAIVLALSGACHSKLQVPGEDGLRESFEVRSVSCYLRDIYAHFIAERIICSSRPAGVIVAFVADSSLMPIVQNKTFKHGKKAVFFTNQSTFEPDRRATFVHRNSLDLCIRNEVPIDATFLANLSMHADDEIAFQRICYVLRRTGIKIRDNAAFFVKKSTGLASGRGLGHCHMNAGTYLNTLGHTVVDVTEQATIVKPQHIISHVGHSPSTLIDRTTEKTVSVTILPATKDVKLSSGKTYIIIGSSDTTSAICKRMIDNGSRYIIVASRRPGRAESWAQGLMAKGICVRIVAMDVTEMT